MYHNHGLAKNVLIEVTELDIVEIPRIFVISELITTPVACSSTSSTVQKDVQQ